MKGFLLAGLLLFSGHAIASTPEDAVRTVIGSFHAALERGDVIAAESLLAPDLVVLESGGQETREEYQRHHLAADIEFAQAVKAQRTSTQVTISGDTAWATSSSEFKGQFRGKAVDSIGAELMVLSRNGEHWRIRAIHWSSRNRPAAKP